MIRKSAEDFDFSDEADILFGGKMPEHLQRYVNKLQGYGKNFGAPSPILSVFDRIVRGETNPEENMDVFTKYPELAVLLNEETGYEFQDDDVRKAISKSRTLKSIYKGDLGGEDVTRIRHKKRVFPSEIIESLLRDGEPYEPTKWEIDVLLNDSSGLGGAWYASHVTGKRLEPKYEDNIRNNKTLWEAYSADFGVTDAEKEPAPSAEEPGATAGVPAQVQEKTEEQEEPEQLELFKNTSGDKMINFLKEAVLRKLEAGQYDTPGQWKGPKNIIHKHKPDAHEKGIDKALMEREEREEAEKKFDITREDKASENIPGTHVPKEVSDVVPAPYSTKTIPADESGSVKAYDIIKVSNVVRGLAARDANKTIAENDENRIKLKDAIMAATLGLVPERLAEQGAAPEAIEAFTEKSQDIENEASFLKFNPSELIAMRDLLADDTVMGALMDEYLATMVDQIETKKNIRTIYNEAVALAEAAQFGKGEAPKDIEEQIALSDYNLEQILMEREPVTEMDSRVQEGRNVEELEEKIEKALFDIYMDAFAEVAAPTLKKISSDLIFIVEKSLQRFEGSRTSPGDTTPMGKQTQPRRREDRPEAEINPELFSNK